MIDLTCLSDLNHTCTSLITIQLNEKPEECTGKVGFMNGLTSSSFIYLNSLGLYRSSIPLFPSFTEPGEFFNITTEIFFFLKCLKSSLNLFVHLNEPLRFSESLKCLRNRYRRDALSVPVTPCWVFADCC